ncbi:MAG: hypothetical protein WC563_15380 [Brevundimonas sp.]
MASPIFRLSYGVAAIGPWTAGAWDTAIDSAKELFIRVDMQSTAGVNALAVSLPSADEVTLAEAAIPITVSQSVLTGIFQLPHTAGVDNTFRSLNVTVTINQGLTNNVADPTLTRSLQVCVPSGSGTRAFVVGEVDEFNRLYGHTPKFNAMAKVAPSTSTIVWEGTCTTTPGAGQTQTVLTIPAPTGACVVQFDVRINGYDAAGAVATTHVNCTAYFTIGGGWVLDPAGLLEAHGYAVDPAWAFGWALGGGGSSITFTVTGDAVNDTDFNARADAFYLYS